MLCNNEVLFIHVPKTAGMAISEALIRALPKKIYYFVPPGHEGKYESVDGVQIIHGDRHADVLKAEKQVNEIGMSIYDFKKIITVIRNPYDMEVSRYFYLRVGHPWDSGQAQKLALQGNFEKFAIESLYFGCKNPSIERFYRMNGCKELKNLSIIRFENLKSEFEQTLLQVGVNATNCLPVSNNTKREHYSKYVTKEAEAAIYERYQWIFDSGFYERDCVLA